ncbi:MAG: SDR family oxidoreductase [Cytophagaceae bacterium]|nr:SDR family oxidoreductase [Cytophagaceae bacterium]
MHLDLTGKKIIVTGASSGIGFAISESLLKSGATVALHYNSGKNGIELLLEKYKNAIAYHADLSKTENCISLFEKIEKEFDKIDMLVQNAGIFEEHATHISNENWLEIWQKTIKINLDAVGILTKLSIEHYKRNQGGRIVYVASRAAFRGETEENLAYAASKGELVSLARTVYRSFGKYGIHFIYFGTRFYRNSNGRGIYIKTWNRKPDQRIFNKKAYTARRYCSHCKSDCCRIYGSRHRKHH